MSESIKHLQAGSKGAFYLGKPGKFQAELSYTLAGSTKMIIDHTRVDDSLRGQGIAQQLVERAVAFAREKNLKVLPLCPYANGQFKKHPEWNDLYLNV